MAVIIPGKTVNGNLSILKSVMLTKTTFGVNLSLLFSKMKDPKETIVMTIGAQVHKKVLEMDNKFIFFIYPSSVALILPKMCLNDNSQP